LSNQDLLNERKGNPAARKFQKNENELIPGNFELTTDDEYQIKPEALNTKALAIINRVQNKLTGRDFANTTLDVQLQVQRLILQATSIENLCQCYIGWCAFW
jgi:serine/threonine-protein kinase mTOR